MSLVRRRSRLASLLAMLSLLLAAATPIAAVQPFGEDGGEADEATTTRYFVLHVAPPLAAYGGGIEGLAPTDPTVTGAARLDVSTPASQAYAAYLATQQDELIAAIQAALGRPVDVAFRYDVVLNGVAVEMSAAEAEVVAGLPEVARVTPDETLSLQTDNGPEWIGAPSVWNGSATGGLPGTQGEGVVVGVIDTGINHDHPSFADVGGDGYNHSNPKGRFFGVCDPVTGAPLCNEKLIGVYDFTGTSPIDDNGHGSHTAGTAAGNVLDIDLVAPTITFERQISGVAPHANVIAYKACVTTPAAGTCLATGTVAAIDQAAADGVDVINFSIGGDSRNPWGDLNAQAFLNARRAGVFASVSAGNDGPARNTVGSPADAPWVMTVGASTHDRKFINSLVGMSGGATAAPGDIAGKSITAAYGPAPIVYAGDFGDPLCQTPFPPGTWTNGEIVICDRGVNPRLQKADNVAVGGAEGFVLANDEPNGDSLVADAYAIPGVHIGFNDGVTLKAWVGDGGSGHTATITGTVFDENVAHGDVMASFSSRGPDPSVPDVLKPDVTAPGVDILAAFNTPATNPAGPPEYNVISGTSMSSPHNAGAAALIRALHPEWTPDQVRSALMTTSFTVLPGSGREAHDILKEDGATPADPFDYGAGRVDLTQAAKAGLVFDESPAAYEAADPTFGGDPATLNVPSLAQDFCSTQCSWERTVTSTAGASVTWNATFVASDGMVLSVSPSSFTLAPGESQSVTVTADVSAVEPGDWRFGRVFLVPDDASIPDVELPVATFVTEGGAALERTVLHFHGNAGVHDSGEPAEASCTGNGAVDLTACGGPFLLPSEQLSPNPAARFGPTTVALDCTVDRCEVDPNWVWNVPAPTTLNGQMTVEWWVSCPGCNLGFFDDFFIRLWADGELVLEQRVRHNIPVPNVPTRLSSTVLVPEVTADATFVLHVDPIFINQDETSILYDSAAACPGGTRAPCDSLVRMPVIDQAEPADLLVSGLTASRQRPRANEPVTVTATVTNAGESAAGASVTEFVLDGGTALGAAQTPELAPGESAEVSVTWDTRGQTGEHTITATADGGGAVAEGDEANNAASLTVTVRGNRVENGSFEQHNADGSGPAGWSASDGEGDAGTASWSEGGSHGERSVTIGGNGGNAALSGAPSWSSTPIPVKPGEVLTVVANVRAEGLSSAAGVGLAYLGPAGEVLDTVGVLSAPLTTDGFALLEETITVPAGVTQVSVVLSAFAPTDLATSGSVTFDDVSVYGE